MTGRIRNRKYMIFGLFGQLSSIRDAATKHKTASEQAFIKILSLHQITPFYSLHTFIHCLQVAINDIWRRIMRLSLLRSLLTDNPPCPGKVSHTTRVYNVPYSFRTVVWVLLRPTRTDQWKCCETGPTVFRPYPRRLESLTVCRCHYKGSTFFSVISKPWVLVRPEFEPSTSGLADRRSPNWTNQAAVSLIEPLRKIVKMERRPDKCFCWGCGILLEKESLWKNPH